MEVGKLYRAKHDTFFSIAKRLPASFGSAKLKARWAQEMWEDAFAFHGIETDRVSWGKGDILLCIKCEKCASEYPLAESVSEPEYYQVSFLDPKGRVVETFRRSKEYLTSTFKKAKK